VVAKRGDTRDFEVKKPTNVRKIPIIGTRFQILLLTLPVVWLILNATYYLTTAK